MANRFATSADMVIQNIEENGQDYLLAIDATGLYLTSAAYVDKKMADPNRYSSARQAVPSRLKSLGLDPAALTRDNQHRIKTETAAKTRTNPLKASKRAARGA